MENIREKDDNEKAFQILSWIYYAKRPLLLDELREALVVRPGYSDLDRDRLKNIQAADIVELCLSLIIHEKTSGIVGFVHLTVHEFFESQIGDLEMLAPTDLAKVCLTYLTFDAFESGPSPDRNSFHQRLKSHQFTDYAIRYWGFYVREKGEEDPEILEMLLSLFKSSQKCNTIRQHALLIETCWLDFEKSWTWTLLHIIALEAEYFYGKGYESGMRSFWIDCIKSKSIFFSRFFNHTANPESIHSNLQKSSYT